MDILLKNAQVITLNGNDDILKEGSIGIKESKIEYIGNNEGVVEGTYQKVIDCRR